MRIRGGETIGLIIDLQVRLLPHITRSEQLIARCVTLLKGLHLLGIPTVFTEQYPKGLGPTDERVASLLGPEPPMEKTSFSCCGESAVMTNLKTSGKKTVLVAGIEAHVCVQQTVLDLPDGGFVPVVVEDCIGSRNESDKIIALDRMRAAGTVVTTVESVLFELMENSRHPSFKAVSALVK